MSLTRVCCGFLLHLPQNIQYVAQIHIVRECHLFNYVTRIALVDQV